MEANEGRVREAPRACEPQGGSRDHAAARQSPVDKITRGRLGVCVDDALVLDAASCKESVAVLRKYKRLRAVEVAICDTLHDTVTDAPLNFVARSLGLRER